MDELLERLSQKVVAAQNLEGLVRPLLEMLGILTGLESTYLTSVDFSHEVQTVLYSRNEGDVQIMEGLQVQWFDTLCKRSLESGRRVVSNVKDIWGDSRAASELGICTYASAPVCAEGGAVIGTLCGISRASREVSSRARGALNVFAKLISEHIERERLIEQLTLANEHLAQRALIDDMTELPNRRALHEELGRLMAHAASDGSYVVVCMIDLDGFKELNDQRGHVVGDQFLQACAGRLLAATADRGLLARIGGDEFAFVAPGPADYDQAASMAEVVASHVSSVTAGEYTLPNMRLQYEGATAGCVAVRFVSAQQALDQADHEMYRVKRLRRAARAGKSNWTFR